MKKGLSRVLVSLLVLVAFFTLAACGSQQQAQSTGESSAVQTSEAQSSQETTTKPAEKVSITWGYWGDPSEVAQNKEVAAAFQQKNPDITVEHMTAPWGDYFTKLQTQFAGNTAPDVMFITYLSTYAPMGVLAEITPLCQQNGFDLSKYPKGAIDSFTYGGKLYGVPRDNDTKVLFYNKKLFDDAQIPYPQQGWTTEQLADTAKKLTKNTADGNKQYGLLFDPSNWFLWVFMNQGKYFDNDENPAKVMLDDQNTVDAIQFMGDLINRYKVTPSYDLLNDGTKRQQLFINNQAAMLIDNHAQIPTFLASKDVQWDVAYLPVFAGKPMANVGGGAGYTINSKTRNVDASWKLWQFLNTDGIKMYMAGGTMVPVNADLLNSPDFVNQPYNAKVFVDETNAGVTFPNNPFWWNVYSTANPFLEKVWVGSATAKDSIKQALPELQKELSK